MKSGFIRAFYREKRKPQIKAKQEVIGDDPGIMHMAAPGWDKRTGN
jgi:hypothetical protein